MKKKLYLALLALPLLVFPFRTGAQSAPRTVTITAKRFAFEPALITLKKGEPVRLQLTSSDVVHGFYLKPLKIDEIIEPGKTTEVKVTPTVAGALTTHFQPLFGGHPRHHKITIEGGGGVEES